MIRSLAGVWKGVVVRGLSLKTVLGKLVLVNETKMEVIYSSAQTIDCLVTDKIVVFPGEAICFTRQFGDLEKGTGRVVVGPEAEVMSWVRYYFFEPHLLPNPDDLVIEHCFLKIRGVVVTFEVLRSYGPEVVLCLRKILRKKYSGTDKMVMVDILLPKTGDHRGTKN